MKVLTVREKQLPDGIVFRNVDILLSNSEVRRLPLEDFGKKLERNVGDKIVPLKGISIQTIHVNEAKKLMTVVFTDGTHEIVKCSPEDCFDTEIGFALALTRKLFGSKTRVRKFISNNAKTLKVPAPQPKKRGRQPRKTVEGTKSQKEEN